MTIQVRDRSNGSEGTITHHGPSHVATSDHAIAAQPGPTIGDGLIAGVPRISPERNHTEVSDVEGGGESCSAETADQGGDTGEGLVSQIAKNIDKCGPVVSKDGIRTYDASVMGPESAGTTISMTKSAIATTPATLFIQRSSYSSNTMRPSNREQLTMGQVQDRKRHPERYEPVVDKAVDSAVQPRQGQLVKTGPAIFNAGDGKPFGSI